MFFFYSITYTEENLNLKCIFGRDLSNINIFRWRDNIHVLCIQLFFSYILYEEQIQYD